MTSVIFVCRVSQYVTNCDSQLVVVNLLVAHSVTQVVVLLVVRDVT